MTLGSNYLIYSDAMHNTNQCVFVGVIPEKLEVTFSNIQGSLYVCAQPMRDDVTM